MKFTFRPFSAFLAASVSLSLPAASDAFTQKAGKGGVLSPIGHEFLVLRAAKDSGLFTDDGDDKIAARYRTAMKSLEDAKVLSKMGWKMKGPGAVAQSLVYGAGTRSKYAEIIKYSLDAAEGLVRGARSLRAFSVAVGQRWVDQMGFAQVGVASASACFNTVAQEPEDVMADHFMLRGDRADTTASAHASAIARFRRYYAAAVNAEDTLVPMRDGALFSGAFYVVDKAYLLLGRAVHLLQDSFSPDHTIRGTQRAVVLDPPYYTPRSTEADYMKIAAIKDWDCSPGTYQHAHPAAGPGVTPGNNNITGDIIWKRLGERESTFGARVADLKPFAKAAFDATKDLYRIFATQRAKGAPQTYAASDDKALSAFIAKWLSLDTTLVVPEVSATSKTHRPACLKRKGGASDIAERLAKDRARNEKRQGCLKRTGRLTTDRKSLDYNKPPYFWRGQDTALSDLVVETATGLAKDAAEGVKKTTDKLEDTGKKAVDTGKKKTKKALRKIGL